MGAVDNLPYAHSKNELPVAIWNGRHTVVGHATGCNVTCELRRPNGLWYKVATQADVDAAPVARPDVSSGTYVSAALVNLDPGPPGFGWGACLENDDQPGLGRFRQSTTAVLSGAAVLAAVLAARAIRRRRAGAGPGTPFGG